MPTRAAFDFYGHFFPVRGRHNYGQSEAAFGAGRDAAPSTKTSSARSLLTSHGFGIRVNLFNYVVLRWDYAIPHDAPSKKGFWQFTLYPPF